MKYYNSDFGRECLYMPHTPMNAKETYNKLVCLRERDMRNGIEWGNYKLSKRRERLIRMYWAFRKVEAV